MEEFEVLERPISIRVINAFQCILCAGGLGVVFLNLCPSTISARTGHAGPERLDYFGLHWSNAGQESVKMATTRRLSAAGESLLVATDKANLAPKVAFKSNDECIKDLLSLWV
jgi:hypothetical protein